VTRALAQDGITLSQVRRDWDTLMWPHARKGFFPFKEAFPKVFKQMGIA
jgi:deoxyribodipyrimidine photo-lyase